eukprot:scaffold10344_cov62-Phaeocystis_antarctica.AAC.3
MAWPMLPVASEESKPRMAANLGLNRKAWQRCSATSPRNGELSSASSSLVSRSSFLRSITCSRCFCRSRGEEVECGVEDEGRGEGRGRESTRSKGGLVLAGLT